jgi:hypothetical protein
MLVQKVVPADLIIKKPHVRQTSVLRLLEGTERYFWKSPDFQQCISVLYSFPLTNINRRRVLILVGIKTDQPLIQHPPLEKRLSPI